LCIATLPVLDRKLGQYQGQFKLTGGMAIPLVALVVSIWLMTHASLKSWTATGIFILIGGVMYLVSRQGQVKREVG
jgi:hypothetical protein